MDDQTVRNFGTINWRSVLTALRQINAEQYESCCTADAIRQRERQVGYKEGYEQGRADALKTWCDAVQACKKLESKFVGQYSKIIVDSVRVLAEKILGALLEDNNYYQQMVTRALDEHGAAKCAAILVHPSRKKSVETILRAEPQLLGQIAVRVDCELGTDDLILEYGGFSVDYRLRTIVANGARALALEEETQC